MHFMFKATVIVDVNHLITPGCIKGHLHLVEDLLKQDEDDELVHFVVESKPNDQLHKRPHEKGT